MSATNYDIILSPAITEKTTLVSNDNQVVFNVLGTATKLQIKQAIEGLFSVKVDSVNTVNRKGKVKRFRGKLGKQNDRKLAYVTLSEGQTIDVTTGL